MRILDLINLAIGVLGFGGIIAIVFLIGYLLVYKRLMKGRKNLKLLRSVLLAIFLVYILMVVVVTILIRPSFEGSTVLLYPFSSYKSAWNSFSISEWKNLILNILMFIPLGFLLPLVLKKCRKCWITYLIGLGFTCVLEGAQYITGRGVVEFDDIFNNLLGCIIGYGGIVLLGYIANKNILEKAKTTFVFILQIPFIICILAFTIIFSIYSKQELGNLSEHYSYKLNMNNKTIESEVELSDNNSKAYIFKGIIGSKEDTLKLAKEVFSVVGVNVDETQSDIYDETIIYQSEDGSYKLWINYVGMTTWFINYNVLYGDAQFKELLEFSEVQDILNKFNINITENMKFKEEGQGRYTIEAYMVEEENDTYINGNCDITILNDNVIAQVSNNLKRYVEYKEVDIITEEEAFERIVEGKFNTYNLDKVDKLVIDGVSVGYIIDSKGFLQPVYIFSVKNYEENIIIPAV